LKPLNNNIKNNKKKGMMEFVIAVMVQMRTLKPLIAIQKHVYNKLIEGRKETKQNKTK